MKGKVYDLSIIEKITGGKPDRILKYINMYIELASVEITELNAFFEAENWEELERTAHKMKSSAGYMGIAKLVDLASYIEEHISENDTSKKELGNKVSEMEELFELVKKGLIEEKINLEG